jgi:hypothetical protein
MSGISCRQLNKRSRDLTDALCTKHYDTNEYKIEGIHSSIALQPFFGPWPLLQFLDPSYKDGTTPWTGGSARRKAATYTKDNTSTK